MAWLIVDHKGNPKEAFRTHAEALHHLPEYGTENFTLLFSPATKLQAARIASGMSQKGLSIRAGIPVGTIQKWEQGSKNINRAAVEDVIKISKALECEIEDILE